MIITFTNGRFIEYKKSRFFEPLETYALRESNPQVTIKYHPFGAGHTAFYLGRSPGEKYQLVKLDDETWRFIGLKGSGHDLLIAFISETLTESEAESVANQHNTTILTKVP